ncbi:ABC transporter substrate-binding protein [Jeotgalibacillus soli]|uniref:Sugar ABC transporter substrate-binding protein n=1 Tax=Jeotgalibacillus soli TaxID=889306 RepID=A0A0C2VYT4_9BACL|nr:sugar ABC transporter substrate-binding protein [Jeotgalibacillus soli]KIL49541.1 hypothetical protein KP78_10090 [Jeotgalibacillus soli]
MKKFGLFALMMIFAIVLAACQGEESGSESGGESESNASEQEVTVWTYPHYQANEETGQQSYEDDLKDLIAEYEEENPGVTVKHEILSWAEGGNKFTAALNSGNPPDIFFSLFDEKYVNTGLAVPISDYVTDEDLEDLNDFGEQMYTYEDELWGFPHYISVHTWGGNRAMLEEAGVDVEKVQQEGWTWDEFYEIAKAGTKTVDGQQVYGFITQGQNEETFTQLMMQNGVRNMVTEDGKFMFTGDKALETLSFLEKLRKDGIMPAETGGIDPAKADEMFNNGQGMVYGRTGPYKIGENENRNAEIDAGKIEGEKIDFVLLPLPHNEGEKENAFGGAGGLMLFKQKDDKGEEHTENAAKLLLKLTSTESGKLGATLSIPPSRQSGQEMYQEELRLDTPNGQFIQRYITTLTPAAKLSEELAPNVGKLRTESITPNYQSFIIGNASPEETVKAWEEYADGLGLE